MKHRLCCLASLMFSVAVAAAAQGAPPASAAAAGVNVAGIKPNPACAGKPQVTYYVNIQRAIGESAEGKKASADLQARFKPVSDDIEKLQTTIDSENKQLANGAATLSEEAKRQLTADVQAKTRDLQQKKSNADSDYQNAETDMINTIGQKMMTVLEQYAVDHCITSINDDSLQWPQSPVLYVQQDLDFTDELIKLYDAKFPLTAGAPSALKPVAPPAAPALPKLGGGGGGE